MKTETPLPLIALTMLTLVVGAQIIHAQGTAFTCQGRLADNGAPATGCQDLQGGLFDAPTGGTLLGSVAEPLRLMGGPSYAGSRPCASKPGDTCFDSVNHGQGN